MKRINNSDILGCRFEPLVVQLHKQQRAKVDKMERKSKLKLITGATVLMLLLSGCGGNSGSGNTGDTANITVEGQVLDDNTSTQNEAGTEGTADSVTSGDTDQSVNADGSGIDDAVVDTNGITDTTDTTDTSAMASASPQSTANTATKPSSGTASGTKSTTNTDKSDTSAGKTAVSSQSTENSATKSSSETATSGTASGTKSTTNTDKSETTQAKTVVMAKIVKISSSSVTVLESTQPPGGMRGVKPEGTPKAADGAAQTRRMGGGRAITFSDTQTTYSVSSTTVVSSMESGNQTSTIKITDLKEGDIVMIELSSDKKSATQITKRPSPQAAGNK
jgi:hypothetical protein